jgi:tetratricopeptide (TPR) repeat protein
MAGEERVAFERQLERILASPGFAQNERLSRFLRFVVERRLEGRQIELKESVIGIEVFGRRPDYNTKRDAIVRTEASRLRARLGEYYANGGNRDTVIVELPKGGYVPVIRRADVQPNPRTIAGWRLTALLACLAILLVFGLALLGIRRSVSAGTTALRPGENLSRDAAGHYTPSRTENGLATKPGRRRSYEDSEAYGLYLRARAAYHLGREIPDTGVDLYQEIIAKDPTFAPAYAGLAAAYAFASSWPMGVRDYDPVKMRRIAEKAIQLDPFLGEARDAMGIVYARLGQWTQSQQSFHGSIELDPKAAAHVDFAMNLLLPTGWIGGAINQVRLAEQSDPLSPDVQEAYAYILISAGEFDQAEEHCRKSGSPAECLGRIRLGQGRIDEAIHILAEARNQRFLGYAYGRAGRRKQAEKLAAISPGGLQQVLIYAGLGDKERTFQALDRMTDLGPVRVGRTLTFPELSLIRGDPRVAALRKKVGLPE